MLQFEHKCTLFYKDDIMPYLLHIYSNCYADKTICKEKCIKLYFWENFIKRKQRHETFLSIGGLGEPAASTTEWNKKC